MPKFPDLSFRFTGLAAALLLAFSLHVPSAQAAENTYSENEIMAAAENLFGATTKGLATVVEKVFQDLGQPNGYIAGDEISGAFIVGLRYGRGELNQKGKGKQPIYWQGPSVGFDFGGNASKSFVLIYNMASPDELYRRFPGVDGSFYFVAGVGVNYQTDGVMTIAPIRTGVGLRAGASLGYLHYTRDSSWFPL
ncbi:MAG: DUF1134 domain-containing protein [Alphaproteobacteria bacterium]|jgi:hypothetical protein|nr:DUF1134 domain-containing protein [Alphaproteobacteria bacterium]MBT7943056.1 DUF1134 domain-containing protein [Alphaproteobacteria bacterium]